MGGLVSFTTYGNFNRTKKYLHSLSELDVQSILEPYGQKGVEILSGATPKRTGRTAASWTYKIDGFKDSVQLSWLNSNKADDGRTPVVVLIINGHGTGWGGYVPPNDFVTPEMEPLCEEAANAIWKAVRSL